MAQFFCRASDYPIGTNLVDAGFSRVGPSSPMNIEVVERMEADGSTHKVWRIIDNASASVFSPTDVPANSHVKGYVAFIIDDENVQWSPTVGGLGANEDDFYGFEPAPYGPLLRSHEDKTITNALYVGDSSNAASEDVWSAGYVDFSTGGTSASLLFELRENQNNQYNPYPESWLTAALLQDNQSSDSTSFLQSSGFPVLFMKDSNVSDFSVVAFGTDGDDPPTAPLGSGTVDSDIVTSASFTTDEDATVDSEVVTSGSFTTDATTAPTIANGPFNVTHSTQIALQGGNLDLVTSVTYSGISVSIDSQSATSLTFTVPDAYANGLGFTITHFIVASDGTNDDTTQNTLQVPSDAHANGEVSGYDNIDSTYESWFDDTNVTVVDGDYWITFNPNSLDGFVVNSDGTFESNETGSFFGRVLDTSDNTDGPDGTWTEEREIAIDQESVSFDQVTGGEGSIVLSWNSIGSALGYQIEYGPSISGEQGQHGPYEIIDVGDVTEYTIENLDGNQVYDVRIRYYE